MKKLNLKQFETLDKNELQTINGGWDEKAMEIGRKHGEFVTKIFIGVLTLRGLTYL